MRTQLRIGCLQIGHSCRLGAHSVQTKWPQGTKTTDTARSRHTLHVLSSRSCCSCSCTSPAPGDSKVHSRPQRPIPQGMSLLHRPTLFSPMSHLHSLHEGGWPLHLMWIPIIPGSLVLPGRLSLLDVSNSGPLQAGAVDSGNGLKA